MHAQALTGRRVLDDGRDSLHQRSPEVAEAQVVALVGSLVVCAVLEDEREDAEVGEVLHVDAGEAQREDNAEAQVGGRERCVFAAGALPVVSTCHDGVLASPFAAAQGLRALRVRGVAALEAEPADGSEVTPEGEHADSGREDLVGRDVVTELEQDGTIGSSWSGSSAGIEVMFGPFTSCDGARFFRRRRARDRLDVQDGGFGVGDIG